MAAGNNASTREMSKERSKALELAVQQIERQFGKGAIMKLGEESAHIAIEAIPTGSIALDAALGVGGVPPVAGENLGGADGDARTRRSAGA